MVSGTASADDLGPGEGSGREAPGPARSGPDEQRVTSGLTFGDHPDLTGGDAADVFGELFDRHAKDLYRYLAARVGASLADDLVADAFVIALRRRETYDPARGTARSWLFGIATNEVRHHHRAEQRHHAATVRLAGQLASISGPEDRVVDRVTAADEVRRLAGALHQLQDLDREILLLSSWAELGSADIGTALSMPAGTVRSRLHRIRTFLRTAAADPQPPDPATGAVIPFPALPREVNPRD